MSRALALALLMLVAGCGRPPEVGPIAVEVIGTGRARPDPDRGPLSPAEAVLLGATAQGLVRFDEKGEIAPGLARRWDVSDDGLYYTFRLAGGAGAVARRLRAVLRADGNAIQPVLGAIDEIVAVTPEVIELRLSAPRPHLLELLAQPELVVPGAAPPMTRHKGLLRPVPTDAGDPPDAPPQTVRLAIVPRPALGVVRFRARLAELVLGGDFADLPLARAAGLPPAALRFDPVDGLFGLEVVRPAGVLAQPDGRRALSLAIDRAGIVARIGAAGQRTAASVGGSNAEAALDERRRIAGAILARLRPDTAAPLTVALPSGPGADLLFGALRRDFATVGVAIERVGLDARANLRLMDAVAPADETAWQLRQFRCGVAPVCSVEADAAMDAARAARTLPERTQRYAEAAALLDGVTPFLPIATPVRWSLAAPTLQGFEVNRRGAHPLDRLHR